MSRAIIIAGAVLALTGCNPATEGAAPEPTPTAAAVANASGNPLEKVLAMPERERDIVFVRAITDAGIKCDGVIKSERMPDQDGKPFWRADCKGGNNSHIINITPDGTANIVSRSDR
jgi:hypothetical protein